MSAAPAPQGTAPNHVRLVVGVDELERAEPTQLDTWAASVERESFMVRGGRVNSAVVGGLLIVLSGVTLAVRFPPERDYGIEIAVVGLLILLASAVPMSAARVAFRDRQKAVASNRVDKAITALGTHGLKIEGLFTLNRRQLDEYQELTRRQQRQAFRLTQLTSVVAFAALIAGVVVTLVVDRTADKIVTGSLAALGTAMSGFLASTFYKTHKAANEQLNRYYLEPQRTGRLLAAERLVTEHPDMDAATLTTILDAIMSWEMPPAKRPKKKSTPSAAAVPANGATPPPG